MDALRDSTKPHRFGESSVEEKTTVAKLKAAAKHPKKVVWLDAH